MTTTTPAKTAVKKASTKKLPEKKAPVKKTAVVKKIPANMVAVEGVALFSNKDIVKTFSNETKMLKVYEAVEKAVSIGDDLLDMSIPAQREEVISRAFRVTKIKTGLAKILNPELAPIKSMIAGANNGLKTAEQKLTALAVKTRQPVTDWDEEQKEINRVRVEGIKASIAHIESLGKITPDLTKESIDNFIEALDDIDCSEGFDEFTQQALQAKEKASKSLADELQQILKKEADDLLQKQLREQKEELQAAQKALEKKATIQNRLTNLQMIPMGLIGKSSLEIQKKLNSLIKFVVEPLQFDERHAEALQSKQAVINQLGQMHSDQLKAEANQKAIDDASKQNQIADLQSQTQAVIDRPSQESQQPSVNNTVASTLNNGAGHIGGNRHTEKSLEKNVVKHVIQNDTQHEVIAESFSSDLDKWNLTHKIDPIAFDALKMILEKWSN